MARRQVSATPEGCLNIEATINEKGPVTANNDIVHAATFAKLILKTWNL